MEHNAELWAAYSRREVSTSLFLEMATKMGEAESDLDAYNIATEYAKIIEQTCPLREHPLPSK